MIEMHSNKLANVPSLFPVVLYHRIDLHLVSTNNINNSPTTTAIKMTVGNMLHAETEVSTVFK